MTRHDLLVHTAAPHRGPTGWFAPGTSATTNMQANLINTVAADARTQPGRRPPGEHSTTYTAVRGGRPTTPKRKTP